MNVFADVDETQGLTNIIYSCSLISFISIMMHYIDRVRNMPESAKVAAKKDPNVMEFLRDAAEKAKCAMSDVPTFQGAPRVFEFDGTKYTIDTSLRRDQLQTCASPLIAKSLEIVTALCKRIKVPKSEIKKVHFVGGSTKMKEMKKAYKDYFEGLEPSSSLDPDTVVSEGAAVIADLSVNNEKMDFNDVASISIGVGTIGDQVETMIVQNTSLPASASLTLYTCCDYQTVVSFPVFETDRNSSIGLKPLATLTINIEPTRKCDASPMKFNFVCNIDGTQPEIYESNQYR